MNRSLATLIIPDVMHLSTVGVCEGFEVNRFGHWHYFFFIARTTPEKVFLFLMKEDKLKLMKKSGPIIVIEDDLEDQMILDEIFKNLNFPNKIIFFSDGSEALNYLNSTTEQPFLILSDINMPRMDGFEVRNRIFKNEKLKCIPYLFFTTGVDKKAVYDAYAMSVQGFFIKPGSMTQLQNTVKKIIEYWQECYVPSQFN